MKIVIDTNILLISISSKSPYHSIVKAFNQRLYDLIVTTPILLEYEEILSEKSNTLISNNMLGAILEAPNVIKLDIYYHWNIIIADSDDNKFTDAYINCDADYLVTNDAHFKIAKQSKFPLINVISADEFLRILNTLK